MIGRGGMGVVYRATDLRLDRAVAVKVLAPEVALDPMFRNRFLREARLAASISHPNIVAIYSTGEQDDTVYLAMQLVDGPDLDTVVARDGALAPERAARIVAQVAGGLDAAHGRGLVHRDVKPGNVLLDAGEHAYLTDFGLVKHGGDDPSLTQPGMMLGTPSFMAPEQVLGHAVDPRADQYGLGCVLFYALTGHVPFERDSPFEAVMAQVNEPPPVPSALVPGLAAGFDAIIARALAKAPDERYPSAGDLGRAALAAAEGAPLPTVAPSVAPALGSAAPPPIAAPPTSTTYLGPTPAAPPEPAPYPSMPAPAPPPMPPPPEPLAMPERPRAEPVEAILPSRQPRAVFDLKAGFHFVHHPLAGEDEVIPLLGNEPVVDALVKRIVHSVGGSFLVTGFRGVGKTTVITRALERLAAGDGEEPAVLPVFLNVARPRTIAELLFEVIRRLFEALSDSGLLQRLAPDVQRQLILAYTRTSLSFKESRGNSVERNRGLSVAPPMLDALAPKLEMSRKTTDSLATEASFLAYSDADVEHDFLRIVSLFQRPGERPAPAGPWARMLRRPPRMEPCEAWQGRIVVVIDELDKLTANEDGVRFVEELLNGIKNLLTTRGVHFLFVAGPDLHDLALHERSRGNSVYDSVFGWQLYVPCVWDATDRLLSTLVEPADDGAAQLAALRDYLNFKARGVPRLLFMEFNSFVQWDGDRARLVLGGPDLARIEFYAALERVLVEFLKASDEGHAFSVAIDEDRWRVGAYYVTDWILRTMGSTFTVDDIVRSDSQQSVDPLLVLSHKKVEALLDHLVEHEIVERVRGAGTSGTFYGDVPLAQAAVYRVAEDIGVKLAAFARVSERERADLLPMGREGEPMSQQPWADTGAGGVVRGGRYELREEVDRGGMGRVYRAHDRVLDREVAVKLLDDPTLLANERMRARFERRGRLAVGLEHPNIVPTYETFTEDDGRPGIVMGWVDGVSLAQLMRRSRIRPPEAVRIAAALLEGLSYLDARGIARLDLKPSGVLIDPSLRPVVIDLGLAKRDADDDAVAVTMAGVFVGTPEYVAPELITGASADIRADMYTLGLILVEMLSGHAVRKGDPMELMVRTVQEDVALDEVECSDALREVLHTATAREPDARFATCEQMRAALLVTPEGGQATVASA